MIEIKKEEDSTYRFFVKTKGGNALLQSVSFPSKKELDQTIKKLSPLVNKPAVFERLTSHNGKFHFSLKDSSGQVIGTSKTYGSEAGMENGIVNVRKRILELDNS